MTPPEDSVSDVERAIGFMRHNGLCAIIGGYGYCSCGRDEAEEKLRAVLAVPINKIGEDAKKPPKSQHLPRALAYTFCGKLKVSEKAAIADQLGITLDYQRPMLDRDKTFLRAVIDAGKVDDLTTAIRRLSTSTDKGVSNAE